MILMKSIGVVVLTLNAEKHLMHCLTPFLHSALKPKILVVDSSSTDQTVKVAKDLGVEVLSISRDTFNHGETRELARRHLKTEIVVMVTPDAYAVNNDLLEKLVKPIQLGQASIAYARQIPHLGAGFFEAFPRAFNYPAVSEVRCIADLRTYGSHTFFCSDSCAAYLNQALDQIQGFKHVILGEDTLATAELLKLGHKIAYVADAEVYHSHCYSLRQEFSRYFDTGLMRKQYEGILSSAVSDQVRGQRFAKEMLKQLLGQRPWMLPYALMHLFVKWGGYQLGQRSLHAPLWWKKLLSSQKYYWEKKASS